MKRLVSVWFFAPIYGIVVLILLVALRRYCLKEWFSEMECVIREDM